MKLMKRFSVGGAGIIIYTVFLDDSVSLNCFPKFM